MAKVKTKNNTGIHERTYTEWAYENAESGEDFLEDAQWIPEDDELAASHKALGQYGTGRIAHREVTEIENRDGAEITRTHTAWTARRQTLLTK